MKALRRFGAASVLMLAFSVPTFAGWISTTVTQPPPPPPEPMTTQGQTETSVAGDASTESSDATASDSVSEIALNLLQGVLSLL